MIKDAHILYIFHLTQKNRRICIPYDIITIPAIGRDNQIISHPVDHAHSFAVNASALSAAFIGSLLNTAGTYHHRNMPVNIICDRDITKCLYGSRNIFCLMNRKFIRHRYLIHTEIPLGALCDKLIASGIPYIYSVITDYFSKIIIIS